MLDAPSPGLSPNIAPVKALRGREIRSFSSPKEERNMNLEVCARSGARNASGGARRDLSFDAAANCSIRDIEVVAGLKIDPELRRSGEIPGQAKCRVRRNPAAAKHDVIDARARHPDRLRERVNADLHRFQEI